MDSHVSDAVAFHAQPQVSFGFLWCAIVFPRRSRTRRFPEWGLVKTVKHIMKHYVNLRSTFHFLPVWKAHIFWLTCYTILSLRYSLKAGSRDCVLNLYWSCVIIPRAVSFHSVFVDTKIFTNQAVFISESCMLPGKSLKRISIIIHQENYDAVVAIPSNRCIPWCGNVSSGLCGKDTI